MRSRDLTPDTKVRLPLSASVAVAGALALSGGTFAVAQYRLTAGEERIAAMEASRATDRELLVRIDERTAEMKRLIEARKSADNAPDEQRGKK